jgi:ubiquinone/menaquinone biosynthesis C-methylase UbiE
MGTREGYDEVAADYAAKFIDELDHKPFDREVLAGFAAELRGQGDVLDVGCGPGQIAAFLAANGADVRGVDLSSGMIEQARRLHPALTFDVADMRSLPFADDSLAGISAFYSIIHIPRDEAMVALREFQRVLRPGGRVLLAFHLGHKVDHIDEWWGHDVFYEREEMEGYLANAGFEIVESKERDPYADGIEAQTRRAYVLAASIRPAAAL